MPTMKLTQVAVERLKPPATGRVEYWDTQLPGFGLRVSSPRPGARDGRKTWQCMYRVRGKLVRETIATLATIEKVDEARALARASIERAQKGVHPIEERQRLGEEERRRAEAEEALRRDTVAAVIERYLSRYAIKRMRPDYYAETKRTLDRDIAKKLGSRPIRELTRKQIRELIEGIAEAGSPSQANHALAYLRAMLNWAVSNDLIDVNPADGLKMPAPLVERDRALSDDEVRLFWLACEKIGHPFGPLFKLLLLTAQRRDELAEATWSEFDLGKALWTLRRARAKNGKAHLVHLSPAAVAILESLPRIGTKGYVFTTTGRGRRQGSAETPVSGFGGARERLAAEMLKLLKSELKEAGEPLDEAKIDPFTLHDLRRTATTGMAGLNIAPHVLDKVLNHVSGSIRGVAAIYNRHAYLDERKAALDAWARKVESLVRPLPSNVVTLAAAG